MIFPHVKSILSMYLCILKQNIYWCHTCRIQRGNTEEYYVRYLRTFHQYCKIHYMSSVSLHFYAGPGHQQNHEPSCILCHSGGWMVCWSDCLPIGWLGLNQGSGTTTCTTGFAQEGLTSIGTQNSPIIWLDDGHLAQLFWTQKVFNDTNCEYKEDNTP